VSEDGVLVVLIHKQQCGSAVICVRGGIDYGRQAMTGERIRSKAKTSLWMEGARFDEAEWGEYQVNETMRAATG
jgi:hypothetical protein